MTTVLVIRSDDKFSSMLREAGLDVVNLELIKTQPLDDLSELRVKLSKLSEYDGLFFTSPVAAEIFVKERNGTNGFHGSVYALGRRAQELLASSGLNMKASLRANTAEEMLNEFGHDEFVGKRFLFVRGEKSLRNIPESLCGKATVDEVVVYKTEAKDIDESRIKDLSSRLERGDIEFVCCFSPSGVEGFLELFGSAASNIRAAVIGTTTAEAVYKAGLNTDYISPRSNANDFANGLIKHIKNIE